MEPRSCKDCRKVLPRADFSKRMYFKNASVRRCVECVARAEAAERAVALARQAPAAVAEAEPSERFRCSGCSLEHPASSYSRSQLSQKGDLRRCSACISSKQEHSLLSLAASAPVKLPAARAPPQPRLDHELSRLKSAKSLRRLLHQLCVTHGAAEPVLAFDRYMARSRLGAELSTAGWTLDAKAGWRPPPPDSAQSGRAPRAKLLAALEPLLPSSGEPDAGLVKDLMRGEARTEAQAQQIAAQLAAAAAKAAAKLREPEQAQAQAQAAPQEAGMPPAAEVVVEHSGEGNLRLHVRGSEKPWLEISRQHFDKLALLHGRHAPAGAAELQPSVLALLIRYAALGAHGYQAALSPAGFQVLHERLGVGFECFASPLNCRYERYCSAFPDVDGPFGSLGSFFHFFPDEGSFEANPPFVPDVMLAAVRHAETLLER